MFNFTKAHIDYINSIPTVKFGNAVPNDAVNLTYFYNKRLLPKENIFIVGASQKTIDHLDISNVKHCFNAYIKDESVFPNNIIYKDNDGYESNLIKSKVQWASKVNTYFKEKILKYENIVTNKSEILESMSYDDEEFKGTLNLVHLSLIPFVTDVTDTNGVIKKTFNKKDVKTNNLPNNTLFENAMHINEDNFDGNLGLQNINWLQNYKDNLFTDYISKLITYSNLDTIPNLIDYTHSNNIVYKFPLYKKNTIDIVLDIKDEDKLYSPNQVVPNTLNYTVDNMLCSGKLLKVKAFAEGTVDIKTVYYNNEASVPTSVVYNINGVNRTCSLVLPVKTLQKNKDVTDTYYDVSTDVPQSLVKVIDNLSMNGTLHNVVTITKTEDITGTSDLYDDEELIPYGITRTIDDIPNMIGTLKSIKSIKKSDDVTNYYGTKSSVPQTVRKVIDGINMKGTLNKVNTTYIDNVKIEDKYDSKTSVPQTIIKVIDGISVTGTLIDIQSINISNTTYDIGISHYWSPSKNGYMYGGHSSLHKWTDRFPVAMRDKYNHYVDEEGTMKELGWSYAPEIADYYSSIDATNNPGMLWLDNYNLNKGWPPKDYVLNTNYIGYNYLDLKSGYSRVYGQGPAGVHFKSGGIVLYPGGPRNYYAKPTINFYKKGSTITKYYGIYRFEKYYGTYDFAKYYGNYEFKKYYGNYDFILYFGNYDYTTYYGQYLFNKYECEYKGKVPIPEVIDNYNGIAYYSDELSKVGVIGKTENIKNYKANAIYQGVVDKKEITYDGTAYYEGIAIRPNTVGNILPELNSTLTLYPDNTGKLRDEVNNYNINSEMFYITDVFKDDEPLFYRYKLSYPVYDSNGPDEFGYTNSSIIKFVNTTNQVINFEKNKYLVKLENKQTNVYDVYIYTNFEISSNTSIYCVYNAYDLDKNTIITSYKESIKVSPFLMKDNDYTVTMIDTIKKINNIVVSNPNIISDNRNKIKFTYKITTTDGAYESNSIEAYTINYDYALEHEKPYFKGMSYCVSLDESNYELSAIDIIVRDSINDFKDNEGKIDIAKLNDLKNKTFKAFIDNSELNDKVYIFTNPDGNSPVYAETTEDTGFLDPISKTYTLNKKLPTKYTIEDSVIYPMYAVKCNDIKEIKVMQPTDSNALENWHPRIQYGRFTKEIEEYGVIKTIFYAVNEYNNQIFSTKYKKPYIDIVDEIAEIIDDTTIKVKHSPLYVNVLTDNTIENLTVKRISIIDGSTANINVLNWSFKEGIIKLQNKINVNDVIKVSYTYEENCYTYRGFYNSYNDFIDIDLNPLKYHTFLDNRKTPYTRKPVYELFNNVIYFFVKPNLVIQNKRTGDTFVENIIEQNDYTVYHKIDDDKPNGVYDILIGKVYIRHNSSSKNIILIDTRTRGGGIKKNISDNLRRELEIESDYYFDIGCFDGEPFNENAVIMVRIDKKILIENGGNFTKEEASNAVNKWIALGTLPIIEFI